MGNIYNSSNIRTFNRGALSHALLNKIICSVLAMMFSIFYAATSYSAVVIQEFESSKAFKTQLKGVKRVKHKNPDAAEGKYAALWDTASQGSITLFTPEDDWTSAESLQFSVHSEVANLGRIRVVIYSQNLETDGDDYYEYNFVTNWTGWKTFNIPFSSMPVSRQPLGFSQIDKITMRSYKPLKGKKQNLMIDDVILTKDLVMPNVFSDDMIIQRNQPIYVEGKSLPGQKVDIKLSAVESSGDDLTLDSIANAQGYWSFSFPAHSGGGPYELTVRTYPLSSDERGSERTINNIYFGDVFFMSGSSNLESTLNDTSDGSAEIRRANYPMVRMLSVARGSSDEESYSSTGVWNAVSPDAMKRVSALAYYFARDLHKQIKVPVGIIISAHGSTSIQPWISKAGYSSKTTAPIYQQAVKDFAYIRSLRAASSSEASQQTEKDYALLRRAYRLPTATFNGMVNPFVHFPIRGVVLYQGEYDVRYSTTMYGELLPALIDDWRDNWNIPDLPFFIVQLASHRPQKEKPSKSAWAEIRDVQEQAAMNIPHVSVIPTIDLSDASGNGVPDSVVVGRRLMVNVYKDVYGYDGLDSGPTFKKADIKNDKIVLSFDHIAGGLILNKADVPTFAIAGSNGRFYWADQMGVAEDNTVVISSSRVKTPKYVRYAWSDNPSSQLMNSIGLPAHPFRTDDLPYDYSRK